MKKIATLEIWDSIYNYYEDEDDELIINRIGENGKVWHNPDWDIDILTDDLPFLEIIYLDRSYADIYINENDFHEVWDDLYNLKRIPINSDAVVEKIKRYLNGEK